MLSFLSNIFSGNIFYSQLVNDFINDTSIETENDVYVHLRFMENSDIKDLIQHPKLFLMKPDIISNVFAFACNRVSENILIYQLSNNMTTELLELILDRLSDRFIVKLHCYLLESEKNIINNYMYKSYVIYNEDEDDDTDMIELFIENNIDYEYIDNETKELKYLVIEMIKNLEHVNIKNLHSYPRINILLQYYILSEESFKVILPDITDDQYYDILDVLYYTEMNRPFIEKVFLNGRIPTSEVLGLFLKYTYYSNHYWNNLLAILSITNYLPHIEAIEKIIVNEVNECDSETFINILKLLKSDYIISYSTLLTILLSPNIKFLNDIYDNFNVNCFDFYNYLLKRNIKNKYIVIENFVNSCKYTNLHNTILSSIKHSNSTITNIEIEFSFTKFTKTNRTFCYKENDIYNEIVYYDIKDNPFYYIPT